MNMTEAVAVSRYILWPWLEPPTSTITTFWCISSTWQRTIAQIPHTTAVSGRASDTFKHHCYSILKPHSLYNLWICPSPPTPCQLDSREQLGAAFPSLSGAVQLVTVNLARRTLQSRRCRTRRGPVPKLLCWEKKNHKRSHSEYKMHRDLKFGPLLWISSKIHINCNYFRTYHTNIVD